MRIDYFFSLMSPYAYLAGRRLEALAGQRSVDVAYHPFDILAVFQATGGAPVAQRHAARQSYRLQDLRRRAARAGLPITLQPAFYPVDARQASVALIAAQMAGFSVGLTAHAYMRALWAEEKNIADPTVVSDVLTAHGVPEADLEPHRAAAEDAYARSAATAEAAGVFGSPSYVVGREVFWGADRLDDLEEFLSEEIQAETG